MTMPPEPKFTWVWPFTRLRYRLRHGHWCSHDYGKAVMIQDGAKKMKRCKRCDYAVIFP